MSRQSSSPRRESRLVLKVLILSIAALSVIAVYRIFFLGGGLAWDGMVTKAEIASERGALDSARADVEQQWQQLRGAQDQLLRDREHLNQVTNKKLKDFFEHHCRRSSSAPGMTTVHCDVTKLP